MRRSAAYQEVFRLRDAERGRFSFLRQRRKQLLVLLLAFLQLLQLLMMKNEQIDKGAAEKAVNKRFLGDKWLDWNGQSESGTESADTGITVSLALAGVVAVILVGLLFLLWYLVTPRLNQFHPAAPWIFGALIALFSLFVFAMGGSLILTLRAGRNYLLIRNSNKIMLDVVSILQRLGKKFGFTADRVSNSLLKVNNALILATIPLSGEERVLLLLPRCLTKEMRQEITNCAEKLNLSHAVCTGGEDARKKIMMEEPSLVVAVACERDLIAGIRDVRGRLPVIGIPNSRPQGPCKCTEINVKELVATLRRVRAREAPPAPIQS